MERIWNADFSCPFLAKKRGGDNLARICRDDPRRRFQRNAHMAHSVPGESGGGHPLVDILKRGRMNRLSVTDHWRTGARDGKYCGARACRIGLTNPNSLIRRSRGREKVWLEEKSTTCSNLAEVQRISTIASSDYQRTLRRPDRNPSKLAGSLLGTNEL